MKEDLFSQLHFRMGVDDRINVYHKAIMGALLQLYAEGKKQNPFQISRRQVMTIAKIRGCPTYHKYLRELEKFHYLEYTPSYHPANGSRIYLK